MRNAKGLEMVKVKGSMRVIVCVEYIQWTELTTTFTIRLSSTILNSKAPVVEAINAPLVLNLE